MQLVTVDQFLTNVTHAVPKGFVAYGIHPSSEVDVLEVEGRRLGVGGILPVSADAAHTVTAIRRPTGPLAFNGLGARVSRDGLQYPGEKLVLQCYEKCDALVPPPACRVPAFREVIIADEDLDVLPAAAVVLFRLPMQGRNHARIAFQRDDDTVDVSITVVGAIHGVRAGSVVADAVAISHYDEDGTYTLWNGAMAMPVLTVAGVGDSRVLHFGGDGDDALAIDELIVLGHSGGAGSGSFYITGEADGERAAP